MIIPFRVFILLTSSILRCEVISKLLINQFKTHSWMTKTDCQGEMPYAQCIVVDEIVRVNMHQRLDLQCGRRLDYHAKRKIDHDPVRKIFFSLPDPKVRIMKLRVR